MATKNKSNEIHTIRLYDAPIKTVFDTTGKEKFVIKRSFDAPIEVVFEMWINPKQLAEWIPPSGATMKYIKADIKPGGETFSIMNYSEHMKLYGRAKYIEIEKPNRLVYLQQFCDENEQVSRHPLAPLWPETMRTTVEFSAESPERTRVTVSWEPIGEVKPEELEVFVEAKENMAKGWTASFDKLEKLIR